MMLNNDKKRFPSNQSIVRLTINRSLMSCLQRIVNVYALVNIDLFYCYSRFIWSKPSNLQSLYYICHLYLNKNPLHKTLILTKALRSDSIDACYQIIHTKYLATRNFNGAHSESNKENWTNHLLPSPGVTGRAGSVMESQVLSVFLKIQ